MEVKEWGIIFVILCIAYFFYIKTAEHFANDKQQKTANERECSEQAINDAYLEYIFGVPNHTVRP